MPRKRTTPNFEQALKELEDLVEGMEQGELSLEESLKSFERGVVLTHICQKALEEAEQKVEILSQREGVLQTEPFETDAHE